MSKVAEYQELRKIADEAIEKAGLIFKEAIVEAIKPVFDNSYGRLNEVRVHGYTPSFNDGDPCTFRMNTDDCKVNGYDGYEDDVDEDEDFLGSDDTSSVQESVSDALSVFDDDDWEAAFNSYGFEVVFTKEDDGSISLTEEDYDCGY